MRVQFERVLKTRLAIKSRHLMNPLWRFGTIIGYYDHEHVKLTDCYYDFIPSQLGVYLFEDYCKLITTYSIDLPNVFIWLPHDKYICKVFRKSETLLRFTYDPLWIDPVPVIISNYRKKAHAKKDRIR